MKKNRFWTFINVHFSKRPYRLKKRTYEKHVVTIMLLFPFFLEKCCDANFLMVFM